MAIVDLKSVATRLSIQWACIAIVSIALHAPTNRAVAQSIPPPPTRDSEIVINPTIAECNRGWQRSDEARWSREQFDQFCAVLTSPAAIVANPTFAECSGGWISTMRWSQDEFKRFCATLRNSK